VSKRKFGLGLSRNIILLGFVSLFTDVSSEMIYPLLPIFLSQVLGASTVFIGIIEGIAEGTASILKLPFGWLSDKIRKRKILVGLGYGLSTISKPLFALSRIPFHVLVVRFSDRVGKGIRTAPRDALIADSSQVEIRGRAYGFHRAMDTLGAVFGPLIAFLLLPVFNNNYRIIFILSFIPAICAVVILSFLREIKPLKGTHPFKISLNSFSKEFKLFIIICIIFTLGNSSNAFLILRAKDVGISPRMIPLVWMTFNIVYALTSTPGGMLSDRIGRRQTIIYSFLLYALVYFGFGIATNVKEIWILFSIYGIYYGLSAGVMRAYVADLVPREVRATAFGVYHMSIGVTAFPSSIIMGVLWQVFGVQFAFSFGAVLSLLAALLLASLIRR
jgi:MFS family permease